MFLPGNWRYDATSKTVLSDDGRIVARGVSAADGALIECAPSMYELLDEQRMRSDNHGKHGKLLVRAIGASPR